MKKIKTVSLLLILAFAGGMLSACQSAQQTPETGENYTVTILNHSAWETKGNAVFYDLTGKKAADVPIGSGKATAELEEGFYLVQIAEAPETVDYGIVLLTAAKKRDTIELTDAQQGDLMPLLHVAVAVVREGLPLSGYQVSLCYEPESGEGGYCLMPEVTDANGLFSETANTGRFHLTVSAPEGTEAVYDEYGEITPARRFLLAENGKS